MSLNAWFSIEEVVTGKQIHGADNLFRKFPWCSHPTLKIYVNTKTHPSLVRMRYSDALFGFIAQMYLKNVPITGEPICLPDNVRYASGFRQEDKAWISDIEILNIIMFIYTAGGEVAN